MSNPPKNKAKVQETMSKLKHSPIFLSSYTKYVKNPQPKKTVRTTITLVQTSAISPPPPLSLSVFFTGSRICVCDACGFHSQTCDITHIHTVKEIGGNVLINPERRQRRRRSIRMDGWLNLEREQAFLFSDTRGTTIEQGSSPKMA